MDMYSQPPAAASYGSPPPPPMPQATYGSPVPPPMAQPIAQAQPMAQPMATPEPTFASGGGFTDSAPITKDVWMGFFFSFLAGVGIGYIYTQRKKNKFPKLI